MNPDFQFATEERSSYRFLMNKKYLLLVALSAFYFNETTTLWGADDSVFLFTKEIPVGIKSKPGTEATKVRQKIRNATSRFLDLRWINYDGNQKNADDRGFSQKSVFAGMLLPNQATGTADDRAEAVSEILVSKKTEEIRRNQVKKWSFNIEKEPLLVRLIVEVWHLGTGYETLPQIYINSVKVGTLNTPWPSLRQRNYVTFAFDNQSQEIKYAFDYQGWVKGYAIIQGKNFKEGQNEISIEATIDQIMIKDLKLEFLRELDNKDTTYDLRAVTKNKPLPPNITKSESTSTKALKQGDTEK